MYQPTPIFVYGFPGLYGGAGTELHHQILLWRGIGIDVHLIPTSRNYRQEALYEEMLKQGVIIHSAHEFNVIEPGAPVFGFCNDLFLKRLDQIYERSDNTVFVNCMTWLFELEKKRMAEGLIRTFLYQNDLVRQRNEPLLRALNPDRTIQFLTFRPYFEDSAFPFIEQRSSKTFGVGRISRCDADKFAANTLHIYEYFVAPQLKEALFLGFNHQSQAKIGKPYDWVRTALNQQELSQQDFYKHCDVVLQPMDTTENWPRVGLEAMASGSVLIVDNRGGWQQMIIHGETGWLCDSQQDFIYYASKMAYEPELRHQIAKRARARLVELAGFEASANSWKKVMTQLNATIPKPSLAQI